MLSYHGIKIQSTNTAIACLLGMALLSLWPSLGSGMPALPTLPQATIDTSYSPPTGNTITVNAGGNFQTALNNANPGDTIVLQAGATFTGNFTLPVKTTGTGWIYIVSSNYSSLPSPGNRVAPTDAPNMATLVFPYGNNGVGIQTASGASNYRFVGVEMRPATSVFMYTLFAVGNGETSVAALPSNITIDRCYIHGDPSVGGRRGVLMNGNYVAVIDSYLSDFKQVGYDTQAVGSYNGIGPFKIANNYLEAAGENIIFGGADPSIQNNVMSDITITGNLISKPLAWMSVTPAWSVKNLLELKNAQRVLIQGNLFQNNWVGAQNGFSILFTPRNQNNTAPWSVVQDVTFTYNTLNNLAQGLNIMGQDTINSSQLGHRILVQNNVITLTGIGGITSAHLFQIINGITDLTIDHNTGFLPSVGSLAAAQNSPLSNEFAFTNNLVSYGTYGFTGTGTAEGTATLNACFTNWTFTSNAIIGDPNKTSVYPSGNYFPATIAAVGFVNYTGGNYALASTSPYKNAGTDGLDLGANITTLGQVNTGVAGTGSLAPPTGLQVTQ